MEFQTIKNRTEGFFKDRGSKFYGYAIPVQNESEIKHSLDGLRKDHHSARHHCYAYVIGLEDQQTRANDDGEPNHSAGDPILGQIRSFGLTNVLVVVVRYFGGTKLGVSGLINVYRTAAQQALNDSERIIIFPVQEVKVEFGYDHLAFVERLAESFEVEIKQRDYRESCTLTGWVRKDRASVFCDELRSQGISFHL
jgi:uncharacterized YigZ family protein